MKFYKTSLKDVYTITLNPYKDERGLFTRVYCKNEFKEICRDKEFVQINHSFTKRKGTIRGLHYQMPPRSETKVIRCIQGKVFDVVVDIRENSLTFLQWIGVELFEEKWNMIYIPEGFAHGFQTLEDNCELLYFHSEFYDPESERGIKYNDPTINIKWPIGVTNISQKDNSYTLITDERKTPEK